MIVHWSMEFDETALRRVRRALGRGGKATRKEVRIWMSGVVSEALGKINVTPPRPKVPPKPQTDDVPPETRCEACGTPRGDHIGLKLDCPLSRRVKPGSKFRKAAPEAAAA